MDTRTKVALFKGKRKKVSLCKKGLWVKKLFIPAKSLQLLILKVPGAFPGYLLFSPFFNFAYFSYKNDDLIKYCMNSEIDVVELKCNKEYLSEVGKSYYFDEGKELFIGWGSIDKLLFKNKQEDYNIENRVGLDVVFYYKDFKLQKIEERDFSSEEIKQINDSASIKEFGGFDFEEDAYKYDNKKFPMKMLLYILVILVSLLGIVNNCSNPA